MTDTSATLAETAMLQLLVAALGGHSVTLVSRDKGRRLGFSIGNRGTIAIADILDVAKSGQSIPADDSPPFVARYRNWRGEVAERRIVPIRVYHGSTDWHPEPQWLLTGFDLDKQAERDFALADFNPPADTTAADREALELQWGKRTPAGTWIASPQRSVLVQCCAHFEGDIVPVHVKETVDGLTIEPVALAPQPADAVREALRELTEACEADCGVPDDGDEDDESVGAGELGPMKLTFGMLRRARAAISKASPNLPSASQEGGE